MVQAFHQLLPPPLTKNRNNNLPAASRSSHRANDDAANLSAMHALQRKAEKKKEKKKRKKEKKKSNDKPENKFIGNNGKIGGDDSDCSSYELDGEEEPLDINSAFVACGRKMGNANGAVGGASRKEDNATNRPPMDPEMMRHRQAQARGMAMQGNDAAAQGLHQKAVKLFTQAAAFDPSDHRFLGNRSFCYEQLKQYDRALSDAEKAIELSSEWPKGYFRRGRALLGLGMLMEAEDSFSRVLKLDPECQEAQEEISNVQRTRLTEMGFTNEQATQAIAKYKQVQAALDALLSGEFHDATSSIFYSDGEEEADAAEPVRMYISAASLPKKPAPPPHQDDIKMNPKNPQGLTSLWVGNVLPEVTEKELQKLFSKYGHVSSVRQLKEKFCAFVNFTDSSSAGRAMTGLQGHTVSGQRLLIKFPDNPITANPASGGARRRNAPGGTSRQPGM